MVENNQPPIEWPSIWRAIAGPNHPQVVLNQGAVANYFPRRHFLQSDLRMLPIPDGFPDSITCFIVGSFLDHDHLQPDHIYIDYQLQPLTGVDEVEQAGAGMLGLDEGLLVEEKVLSRNDLSKLYITTSMRALFQGASETIFVRYQYEERIYQLAYKSQRHEISRGWKDFVDEKGIQEGDTIIFLKRFGTFVVAVRKRIPLYVSGADIMEKVQTALGGSMIRVRYYPRPGQPVVVELV